MGPVRIAGLAFLLAWPAVARAREVGPELRIKRIAPLPTGEIEFSFEERGNGPIPPISWALIVDGRTVETGRYLGPFSHLSTTRVFGKNRYLALRVDPFGALAEASERNQLQAFRFDVPYGGRGDLTIRDLTDFGTLAITVGNIGEGSLGGGSIRCRIFTNGLLADSRDLEIPPLFVGEGAILDTGVSYGAAETTVSCDALPDDADTTNNFRREFLPSGPDLQPLWDLFAHPQIRDATVWRGRDGTEVPYNDWPNEMFFYLETAYIEISEGRDPLPPRPFPTIANGPWHLTHAESLQVYTAYLAQSAWFELHRAGRWSLFSLPYAERKRILGSESIIDGEALPTCLDRCWRSISFAWSPHVSFNFLRGLDMIAADQHETVMRVADFIRDHFVHVVIPDTSRGAELATFHYGTPHQTPEAMLYALFADANMTGGCGPTAQLLQVLLRTVNIPVEMYTVELGDDEHHTAVNFPSVGLRLYHGDDLYGTYHRITYETNEILPSEVSFVTEAQYQALLAAPLECVRGRCNPEWLQRALDRHRLFVEEWRRRFPTRLLLWIHDNDPSLEPFFQGEADAVRPAVSAADRADTLRLGRLSIMGWGRRNYNRGLTQVRLAETAVDRMFRQRPMP